MAEGAEGETAAAAVAVAVAPAERARRIGGEVGQGSMESSRLQLCRVDEAATDAGDRSRTVADAAGAAEPDPSVSSPPRRWCGRRCRSSMEERLWSEEEEGEEEEWGEAEREGEGEVEERAAAGLTARPSLSCRRCCCNCCCAYRWLGGACACIWVVLIAATLPTRCPCTTGMGEEAISPGVGACARPPRGREMLSSLVTAAKTSRRCEVCRRSVRFQLLMTARLLALPPPLPLLLVSHERIFDSISSFIERRLLLLPLLPLLFSAMADAAAALSTASADAPGKRPLSAGAPVALPLLMHERR